MANSRCACVRVCMRASVCACVPACLLDTCTFLSQLPVNLSPAEQTVRCGGAVVGDAASLC